MGGILAGVFPHRIPGVVTASSRLLNVKSIWVSVRQRVLERLKSFIIVVGTKLGHVRERDAKRTAERARGFCLLNASREKQNLGVVGKRNARTVIGGDRGKFQSVRQTVYHSH